MKKKFAAIVIAACLFLSSAVPVFAAAKLSRPVNKICYLVSNKFLGFYHGKIPLISSA